MGRRTTVPSSIRQSAFHVPSALRDVHERLRTHPEVSSYHPVDHDNPFSLYCNDPENNTLELSRESTWYMLAPSVRTLDFSVSNEETLRVSKKRGHSMTGFMMREE